MLWDIFCKVIDNHGDVGVCWRLASDLAAGGDLVRLRVDQASALAWMAPGGAPGVQLLDWNDEQAPGDAVIEAFGCELPHFFQAAMRKAADNPGRQPAWINLEYLTAESFAQRSHGLPSPVLAGPAAGLVKRFFYPGFTSRTGGLLRETDLQARQDCFDSAAWLAGFGVSAADERRISLFCYEPALMPDLLDQLASDPVRTRLLVTAGRATSAVRATGREDRGSLAVTYLPLLTQQDFDHLLWSCDMNFVRGEDSLVRALWAGRAFAWQLYPQDDGAHHEKLDAFLGWLEAPAGLARFHRAWNGNGAALGKIEVEDWSACVWHARDRLLSQVDLVTQLRDMATQERAA